jgi:dephospho-CoA kinase
MLKRIIAIVGMPGAGKSVVAAALEAKGLLCIHFGDLTAQELERRGLPGNEANERRIREDLRSTHGMAAYALLNLPRIDAALERSDVVVDGLYSWEEYVLLKERYSERLVTLAVVASPRTRQERLSSRPVRPLTPDELASRDRSEIEKINKGGPIAMADITLINEDSLEALERQAGIVAEGLR